MASNRVPLATPTMHGEEMKYIQSFVLPIPYVEECCKVMVYL